MSKIEWTDETWNPVVGCSKVSTGCENCYAEKMAARLACIETTRKQYAFVLKSSSNPTWNGLTYFNESALAKPLHWKKPRMIFVSSMGDLFHESVLFEWIDKVVAIIALCPQHTFMFLTKQSGRMAEYFDYSTDNRGHAIEQAVLELTNGEDCFTEADEPLPNLWLGVTAENQKMADERIPILLKIPAAKRFVSVEPMLGEVNLKRCRLDGEVTLNAFAGRWAWDNKYPHTDGGIADGNGDAAIDWVICGCESGVNRRHMKLEWARSLREQCKEAGVPFFMKQMEINGKVRKDINQFPEDLRIREYPESEE